MTRILFSIMIAMSAVLTTSHGQYLLSSEMLGHLTKEQIEAQYGYQVRTGVTLYKATYMTVGTQGVADTASGLIVMPDEVLVEEVPVVAYQHGTTDGPLSVPSRLTAGHVFPIGYGGMGYVVSATDYLGLGDSKGFHPYVHAGTEASAGLDMLIATTEFVEDETGNAWVGPLFVAGYSQGGHGAAALQRELEQNWSFVFPVTASTPMSGPYSMSGVMFERVISDAIYFFPAYIAYVTLAYQEVYGNLYNDLSDLFKTQYVAQIENFYNGDITLSTLNTFLINRLIIDNLLVQPVKMLRDSIVNLLRNDTLDHPLKDALSDNDVYDWAPEVPTRLLYCMADDQVPFMNTVIADSVMNANGAVDVKSMDMDPTQDHGGCAPLAFAESVDFFDSFLFTSGTRESRRQSIAMSVYPNPVTDIVLIDFDAHEEMDVSICDLQGRVLRSVRIYGNGSIDLSSLTPGVYILHAVSQTEQGMQKILVE